MLYIALEFLLFIVVAAVATSVFRKLFERVTIMEYERGLLYRNGRLIKTLEPGSYWYTPFNTEISTTETRPKIQIVLHQELLTADSMSVKITLAINYRVFNVVDAELNVESYSEALHTVTQLALREIVASMKIDELLVSRQLVSEKLQSAVEPKIAEFGLLLLGAHIRDIMVPGELKKVLAQVVKAQKEAQAQLEKARGEAAALRSLANAARMIEANPNLMQLRMLQSIGESQGNTIVYGMPVNGTAVHAATKSKGAPEQPDG